MPFELFIASRYFLTRRKAPFITFITAISVAGIAIGVAALIIVLAVMSGFDAQLQNKIIGVNAHVVVEKPGGIHDYQGLIKKIERFDGVLAASPILAGQAIFKKGKTVCAVGLRGIVPAQEQRVTDVGRYMKEGSFPRQDFQVAIGRELSRRLLLGVGAAVELISPADGKTYTFTISGIFETGMYDYDMNLLVTGLVTAQKFFNVKEDLAGAIQVRIRNPLNAHAIKKDIQGRIGYPYVCATWMELNKNLFSALKLEKLTMFVILTLIVLVACFNILNTLSVVVINKTKDIGILRALGVTARSIKRIFVVYGLCVGTVGTLLGTGIGIVLAVVFDKYPIVSLPADVYYINKIPVKIEPRDVVVVAVAACVISLIATVLPSRQAAKIAPVEALRYE